MVLESLACQKHANRFTVLLKTVYTRKKSSLELDSGVEVLINHGSGLSRKWTPSLQYFNLVEFR